MLAFAVFHEVCKEIDVVGYFFLPWEKELENNYSVIPNVCE